MIVRFILGLLGKLIAPFAAFFAGRASARAKDDRDALKAEKKADEAETAAIRHWHKELQAGRTPERIVRDNDGRWEK